jgi:hypothetical protein
MVWATIYGETTEGLRGDWEGTTADPLGGRLQKRGFFFYPSLVLFFEDKLLQDSILPVVFSFGYIGGELYIGTLIKQSLPTTNLPFNEYLPSFQFYIIYNYLNSEHLFLRGTLLYM